MIDNFFLIVFLIWFFRIIQTKDRKEGINENDENSNAQALTDDRHNFNNKTFNKKKSISKSSMVPNMMYRIAQVPNYLHESRSSLIIKFKVATKTEKLVDLLMMNSKIPNSIMVIIAEIIWIPSLESIIGNFDIDRVTTLDFISIIHFEFQRSIFKKF